MMSLQSRTKAAQSRFIHLQRRDGFRGSNNHNQNPAPDAPASHGWAVPAFLLSPLLLLLLVWLFTAGCQALSYTSPTGERFVRRTWGVTSTLAVLSVECGTNGVRSIRLQGYQADPSRTMSAVTEAAVRAAIQSLKSQAPIPGT